VKHLIALFAVLALGAGCTVPSEEDPTVGEESELTAGSATMTFRADYTESLTGSPAVGGKLRVRYAEGRLPQCRTTLNNGKPGWTITGFIAAPNKAPRTFYVAGHSATGRTTTEDVTLDTAGDVAVWFQVTNIHGCNAWDSNLGKNYGLRVAAPAASNARIAFDSDPSRAPRVEGRLVAGTKLEVAYPEARLPSCRTTLAGGVPGWSITGFASLNGAPAKTFYVAGHSSDPTAAGKVPTIDVSAAGRLSVWFQVTSRSGCTAWDSNNSNNYTFDVAAN
jgi:hypothetical protein